MIVLTIILSIILLLFIIYYITARKNLKQKIINNIKEEYLLQLQQSTKIECEDKLQLIRQRARIEEIKIQSQLQKEEEQLQQAKQYQQQINNEIEQAIVASQKQAEKELSLRKQQIDKDAENYRILAIHSARTAVESAETEVRAQETNKTLSVLASLEEEVQEVNKTTLQAQQAMNEVVAQLAEWQKKQQAANEEIRRRRELEEQQDFYRVCLTQEAIEDIKLLQEIRQKLHKSDNLNKLIYDVYVSKAVLEMTKRVLSGEAPSGIYKITRIKTGEIYIGKSTDVKSRWQQHAKTVYGAGTIAHSILHTTMERDGLENFTFELLEKVSKDKLTEREKYWIAFYGSRDYGLNERCG